MKRDWPRSVLRITLIYVLVGIAWYLLIDQLLVILEVDPVQLTALQTLKGWIFILGSALLIFLLLRREFAKLDEAQQVREDGEQVPLTFLGSLPGMAYIRDANSSWTMQFVSEGCEELMGYKASTIMHDEKMTYKDLIHPDDHKSLWACVEEALEGHRPYNLVYRITTKAGDEKWVLEQGRGVYSADGKLIHLGGFITDITERVIAEQEVRRRVREQEALNAVIVASSKVSDLSKLLKIVLQHTLRTFEVSRGIIWVLDDVEDQGFSEAERHQLGEVLPSLKLTLTEPHFVSDWQDREEDPHEGRMQQVFTSLDFRSTFSIPLLAEGRLIGGLCLLDKDIHHWTEEERELGEVIGSQLGGAVERLGLLGTIQEQDNLLQRILDTVHEGIFTLDSERRILVANPSARVYLDIIAGVGPGEILTYLGSRPLSEFLVPREDGLPHEVETNDAKHRVFEVYPNPVEVDSEEAGWTILLRDVTEVRQVQRRTQEEIRRGAVGQLAAGIAHDFNNIIASIILYSEMVLGMPGLPPKGRQRMNTIIDQAHRAATLTRQILDFSRRGIMEPHPMDLVPFMKELVKLLERTLPENIRVRFNYADNDYVVNSDPARIQQVFMNLAVNARDAMPSGGELSFNLTLLEVQDGDTPPQHGMPPGKWVRVCVSDTGGGIPTEDLPNIFEPFFTTKPPGEGTGLGLAQVFGIVKQHEGFIDVTSQPGQGTSFNIYLPSLTIAALSGIIAEDVEAGTGKMETILVVEDDDAMREALVEMLGLMHYQALSASDGQEALSVFKSTAKVDLVISDLVMPEMGGVALYGVLKEKYPDVRMVVMTGYPLAERGKDLLEQGIVAWLQKPLDADTLARTIKKVLNQ
jgi:PAS domain S-box-containing protein